MLYLKHGVKGVEWLVLLRIYRHYFSSPDIHVLALVLYRVGLSLGESLFSCLPVDDIPDSLEIIGLDVLVLEVVLSRSVSRDSHVLEHWKTYSMLPSIDT